MGWWARSLGQAFFAAARIATVPVYGNADLEAVRGARDAEGAASDDVGVDHGGLEIAVTQQFLDSSDVDAGFE